jgi:tripartite-type tricarboxylate transporter receptor subunit TctC
MLLCWTAALVAAASGRATAQGSWPNRPVRIVDAFGAGGSPDIIARAIGAKLSATLRQPFVVENRTGGGGIVGTDAVAKAPADGYTILSTASAMPTNSATGRNLPFDLLRDLTPIGMVARSPMLLAVPTNSPLRSLRDLVEAARARPDSINYGSSGIGSVSHIGMELLAFQAGVRLVHVPYRGTPPVLNDLVAGQLQVMMGTVASTSQFLAGGRLRGLVVADAQRLPTLPEVPTAVEAGFPDFIVDYWWGFTGPSGMPRDIVMRLNREINAALEQADIREMLARLDATATPKTPEEFGRVIAYDLERWTRLIRDANISLS